MAATLTSSFKITTCWPELIDKRIQSIESSLQEIHYREHEGCLAAAGVIKRRIRYLEYDGRARKLEDNIQFELEMGNAPADPERVLNADLRQDYFIFQPRQSGENGAVLEQGFQLIIRRSEPVIDEPLESIPVWLETIRNSGSGEALVQLHVSFPRAIHQPKKFEGVVRFAETNHLPLISGEITGTISYRSSQDRLQEIEFHQNFSILARIPPLQAEQRIRLYGEINDQLWVSTVSAQEWLLNAQLIYNWNVLEKQEWLLRPPGRNVPVVRGKIAVLQGEERLQLFRDLRVECPVAVNEISLTECSWKSIPIKNGLLIAAQLELELLGVQNGQEMVFKRNAALEETIVLSENERRLLQEGEIQDQLRIQLTHFEFLATDGLVRFWVIGEYQCQIFELKLLDIACAEQEEGQRIALPVFIENNNFSFSGEDIFILRRQPQSIEGIRIAELSSEPQARVGWLVAVGALTVVVSYADSEGCLREEQFELTFRKAFLWNKLRQTDQVVLQPRLEYTTYEIDDTVVHFQYLIELVAQSFREEEHRLLLNIPIPIRSEQKTSDFSGMMLSTPQRFEDQPLAGVQPVPAYRLAMSGEIPLQLTPRELAESRTRITDFSYKQALNSLFVQGRLSGEIDYWDKDGYLRCEPVNYPFWRFVQPDVPPKSYLPDRLTLTPEIRHFGLTPLRAWPWQRKRARIEVEIHFRSDSNLR